MNKSYQITINNLPLVLTLTPPPSWGYCVSCLKEQPIRVTAKHPNQLRRKFCANCGLKELDRLSEHNFKLKTAGEPIKEIRTFLLRNGFAEETSLDYYV